MAGLAHASHDHAPLRGADELDRGDESGPEPVAQGGGERINAAALGFQRAQRRGNNGLRLVARFVAWLWLGHKAPTFLD